ncbi:MAG TPA: ATP-binding protein [Parasegetibacter sp.]
MQYSRKKIEHINEKNLLSRNFEQALFQSQLEIQEQIFTHLSREIHDNIGQSLSLARLNLNTLNSVDNQEKLSYTDELLGNVITELRNFSHILNADHVLSNGLSEAIRNLLEQLEKTGRYRVRISEDEFLPDLSRETSIILFRMVQEVVNNIIKHAGATEIDVLISKTDQRYFVRIADNGKGFDVENISSGSGLGLSNMKKRAELIHAQILIESRENQGSFITIYLPETI